MNIAKWVRVVLVVILAVNGCSDPTNVQTDSAAPPEGPGKVTDQGSAVRFGVVGDFGEDGSAEAAVASMLDGYLPEFIITTGDNNYNTGADSTIDRNIGKYYGNYIYPYTGAYGSTATENRFFPSLGNIDWETPNAQPYLDYFTLPGNERYYDLVRGPVHFIVLDSDPREPDGTASSSTQA